MLEQTVAQLRVLGQPDEDARAEEARARESERAVAEHPHLREPRVDAIAATPIALSLRASARRRACMSWESYTLRCLRSPERWWATDWTRLRR